MALTFKYRASAALRVHRGWTWVDAPRTVHLQFDGDVNNPRAKRRKRHNSDYFSSVVPLTEKMTKKEPGPFGPGFYAAFALASLVISGARNSLGARARRCRIRWRE